MAAVPPFISFVFNPEMVDARDENVENMSRMLCDTNSVLTNAMLSNAVNQLVRHTPLTNDEYDGFNRPLNRVITYDQRVLDIRNFPNLQDELRNIGYCLLAFPSLNRNHEIVGNMDQQVTPNDNVIEPPNGNVQMLPFSQFDTPERFLIGYESAQLGDHFYQRLYDYDRINRDIVPLPLSSLQAREYLVYSNGDRVPIHPVVTELREVINIIDTYQDTYILYDLADALPFEDYNLNEFTPPERVIIYDPRVFNVELYPSHFDSICHSVRRAGYELVPRSRL
jgi:hypothetical protein